MLNTTRSRKTRCNTQQSSIPHCARNVFKALVRVVYYFPLNFKTGVNMMLCKVVAEGLNTDRCCSSQWILIATLHCCQHYKNVKAHGIYDVCCKHWECTSLVVLNIETLEDLIRVASCLDRINYCQRLYAAAYTRYLFTLLPWHFCSQYVHGILWILTHVFTIGFTNMTVWGDREYSSSFLGSTAQLRPWPPPQNPAEFRGGFSTIFFFTG
jgi:hypothetical protein